MKLFSQRKGIKPIKNVIQVDSIDSDLRNCLWSALTIFYLNEVIWGQVFYNSKMHGLLIKLCHYYFKRPIDTMSDYWPNTHKKIKKYFFNCPWYEVYDFIEFIAN